MHPRLGFLEMANDDDKKTRRSNEEDASILGVGSLFDGVTNLLGKFGELAEKAEALRNSQAETTSGKKIAGSYGFSVKFGAGNDSDLDVKSVRKNTVSPSSKPPAAESRVREPHVEMFDEGDHLLIVAEMPGVSSEDVSLTFVEKTLHIKGASKFGQFSTAIDLPREVGPDQVTISANNGVVELRIAVPQ